MINGVSQNQRINQSGLQSPGFVNLNSTFQIRGLEEGGNSIWHTLTTSHNKKGSPENRRSLYNIDVL